MTRKRIPIEERIVFKTQEFGKPLYIDLDVDGDNWKVVVQLINFKTDERGVTYHLNNVLLHPPLQNMIARIQHQFPHIKITVARLEQMLKDAIRKGIFEERTRTSAVIYLTLDSWLLLKVKSPKSKLVFTTPSKYRRLVREEEQLLNEAFAVGSKTPMR